MRRLGVTIAVWAAMTTEAQAFCVLWEDPIIGANWWCDDAGHDYITEQLDFLAPGVLATVVDNNVREDQGTNAVAPNKHRHVDECRFDEWTTYMNGRYHEVIDALDPSAPRPYAAAESFGRVLHGIQDFYAHSNWVEIMEDIHGVDGYFNEGALLDHGTGFWPMLSGGDPLHYGLVVVGSVSSIPGRNPIATWLPDDETVPLFTMPDGAVRRALVTGWNPVSSCPDLRPGRVIDQYSGVTVVGGIPFLVPRDRNLVHGGGDGWRPCDDSDPTFVCLNKDNPNRPYYDEAEFLAKMQTEQEWCRVLSLTRDVWPDHQGSTQLLTLWTDDESPQPQFGATCSPVADGAVEVKVTVTGLTVAQPHAPGLATFGLAMYNDTFTRIDRSSATGSRATNPTPPASVRLCLDPGETAVVGLWGSEEVPSFFEPTGLDGNDLVIRGATAVVGPEGTFTADGADHDFTYRVEIDPSDTDPDSDGLSACGETWYGSSPTTWDTDGDFFPDGYEVNTVGTSPTNPDTDGDYLGDGERWTFGTDPLDPDTDDDGIGDGLEVWNGTDPLVPQYAEFPDGGDEVIQDDDQDGFPDLFEAEWGLDPKLSDSDGDGLFDGRDPSAAEGGVRGLGDEVLAADPKAAAALRDQVLAELATAEKLALDKQPATEVVAKARELIGGSCVDHDPLDKIEPGGIGVCAELDRLAVAIDG